jgi:acetyl esterase/lipase
VAPWIFLAVCTLGALCTLAALVRARRLGAFAFPYFMVAWLTGELALFHLAWQLLATAFFAWFGAFEAWPGWLGLGLAAASWLGLLAAQRSSLRAGPLVRAALAEHGLASEGGPSLGALIRPFRFERPGVERIANVAYGAPLPRDKGRRNLLDVIRPAAARPGERRPALLQVHGGAWTIGEKEQQGQPLVQQLAARGWVCFAQNYRLSPRARFPDHIVDVKRAIAWIRAHAGEYGADPDFLCITGGSAGGHLAALAALSANDPAYQPGFEQADTRLAACVPFYGVYDFLDRDRIRGRQSMRPFLERRVFPCTPAEDPELWEQACPLSRIHADAPPFLVIHGSHDSLVFVEEARAFVARLREKSRERVLYLEVPGAQHAFDLFHSVRGALAVNAATAFLEDVRRRSDGMD